MNLSPPACRLLRRQFFDICIRNRRRTNLFVIVKGSLPKQWLWYRELVCGFVGLIEAPDLDVLDLFSHIAYKGDARGV
jgi:hypothetical protein